MFAKNEPNALKEKRNQIERDIKLGKLTLKIGNRQKVKIFIENNLECILFHLCTYVKLEVLTALRHLGCELTDSDKIFIQEETSIIQNSTSSNGFNIPDTDGFGEIIMLLIKKVTNLISLFFQISIHF